MTKQRVLVTDTLAESVLAVSGRVMRSVSVVGNGARGAVYVYGRQPNGAWALQATLTPGLIQHASRHGVYVCYHRADEVFALDISMALQEARVKVWMDEMEVPDTAEDWRGAVDAGPNGPDPQFASARFFVRDRARRRRRGGVG